MQWIDDNWKAIAVIAMVVYLTQAMLWRDAREGRDVVNNLTGARCYDTAKLACW